MQMLFVSKAGNACRIEIDEGRIEMLVVTFWDTDPTDDDLAEVSTAVAGALSAILGYECVVEGSPERASNLLAVQAKRAKHMMMECMN